MYSSIIEGAAAESLDTPRFGAVAASFRDRVWQICWSRQQEFLKNHAADILPEFLIGVARLGLPQNRLPDFAFVSEAIRPAGWKLRLVEGFIPSREYFRMTSERCVAMAKNLRSLADAEHSPQPDMLHDVFGHLPMLFSQEIMELNLAIAAAGIASPVSGLEMDHYAADLLNSHFKPAGVTAPEVVRAAQARVADLERQMALSPSAFDKIRKIYLWALEFGVLLVDGRPRAFGAGLLSSRSELVRFSRRQTPLLPFDARVLDYEINFTGHQDQFFLIDDLSDVYQVLDLVVAEGRL